MGGVCRPAIDLNHAFDVSITVLMLDPRRMLTFREVARLGSFSRAAEELSLTQPAVSQQILSLERQLGIRLIDRGPGGLALTDAGAPSPARRCRLGRLRLASSSSALSCPRSAATWR